MGRALAPPSLSTNLLHRTPFPSPTEGAGCQTCVRSAIVRSSQIMQDTIRAYTSYTLNGFKQMAGASVDKVTLEFGVKVAGEAGVPYVTKRTADANLKVTMECSFPKES